MSAPTPTSFAESNALSVGGNEVTGTLSWNAGARIVVLGMTEDQSVTLGVPTGGGLSFAHITGSPTTVGSSCKGYAWEATAGSSGSAAITSVISGGNYAYIAAFAFDGSEGLGGTGIDVTTAKTVNVTRAGDNSFVVGILGDWSADADTAVTSVPAGATAREAARNANYAVYAFEWGDQGVEGTTAYGLTDSTSLGTFTKFMVEVKGTAPAAQVLLPDADIATTGWTATPLHSKLADESDATVITGTLA